MLDVVEGALLVDAASSAPWADGIATELLGWLQGLASRGCVSAAAALAHRDVEALERSVWVCAAAPPLWAPRGARDARQQCFAGEVGDALLWLLWLDGTDVDDCYDALCTAGPYVLMTADATAVSNVLACLFWCRSRYTGTATDESHARCRDAAQPADGGLAIALYCAQDGGRGAKLACVALYALLPRAYARAPEETRRRCIDSLLGATRQPGFYCFYDAILKALPRVLTLDGGQHDADVQIVYASYAHSTVFGTHPRALASLWYCGPGHRLRDGLPLVLGTHRCSETRCPWWHTLCDHILLLLRLQSPHGTLSGKGDELGAALVQAQRFREYVKLVASDVISPRADYVPRRVWTVLDIDAGDIIGALVAPQPDDTELAVHCAEEQCRGINCKLVSYMDAISWLMTWPRGRQAAGFWPRRLPAWTPHTHRALYRFCRDLHAVVRTLLLVWERDDATLAALPRELLEHLFHCLTLVLCPRSE